MRSRSTYVWAYLAYGVALDLVAGMFGGMGEGRAFAWTAVFGSPLTMIVGAPGWPVWLLFGWLLKRGWLWSAALLLAVHYLAAPSSVHAWLEVSWSHDLRLLLARAGTAPKTAAVLLAVYPVGQIATWWLLVREWRRRRDSRGARM